MHSVGVAKSGQTLVLVATAVKSQYTMDDSVYLLNDCAANACGMHMLAVGYVDASN